MNGIISCATGTLGRDAELRYTQAGLAVLNFSIAVQDAKKGEAETEWLKVTVWAKRPRPSTLPAPSVRAPSATSKAG